MTEILMAILMIAIGTFAEIATKGDAHMVMIFSLITGIYFIYDILKEVQYGKTHHRH